MSPPSTTRMGEPYENRMSIQALRDEVRLHWDRREAFANAIRDLPDVPDVEVLWLLSDAAHGMDFWEIGKLEQRKHDVPPKCELECGMGLWAVIRDALRLRRSPATPTE